MILPPESIARLTTRRFPRSQNLRIASVEKQTTLRAEFVPGEDNHPVFTGCGERPGAARVCDPHVVPELGPMTSHRSTHVSDADDADLHVLAACSNGQAEEATLEEDHIARRRTCRQLRELGQRPLALLRRLRSIGLA
jgi:hypothetical protein